MKFVILVMLAAFSPWGLALAADNTADPKKDAANLWDKTFPREHYSGAEPLQTPAGYAELASGILLGTSKSISVDLDELLANQARKAARIEMATKDPASSQLLEKYYKAFANKKEAFNKFAKAQKSVAAGTAESMPPEQMASLRSEMAAASEEYQAAKGLSSAAFNAAEGARSILAKNAGAILENIKTGRIGDLESSVLRSKNLSALGVTAAKAASLYLAVDGALRLINGFSERQLGISPAAALSANVLEAMGSAVKAAASETLPSTSGKVSPSTALPPQQEAKEAVPAN